MNSKAGFKVFISWICILFTFPSFSLCFSPIGYSKDYNISSAVMNKDSISLNGEKREITLSGNYGFSKNALEIDGECTMVFKNGKCNRFNYYGISYSSDAFLRGKITYFQRGEEKSEEFFLEPNEAEASFYSLTDDYFAKKKANKIISLSLSPVDKPKATVTVYGIGAFNRKVVKKTLYAENKSLKMGVDLSCGGGLSYLEDLDSRVEAVKVDGKTKVDSNASSRYHTIPVKKRVNLLNNYDTGRLVQQSYYGKGNESYVPGTYMESDWLYNPVQGGNKYNEKSKIVDFKQSDDGIYIKCRPLDWAKEKEAITPSYMEATYSLTDNMLNVACRFIDFSASVPLEREQEMPAFYCVEPLNKFYYAQDGKVICEPDLIFWPDAGYPKFKSDEGWTAFAGEFEDSFGIGIYMPGEQTFLSGVFERGSASTSKPCCEAATSYMALLKTVSFTSFVPMEYSYSICTGTVDEIRQQFTDIAS